MTKKVKIRITKEGIYGPYGSIPVGTELEVSEDPVAWAGRYEIISDPSGKDAVTNDQDNEPAQTGSAEAQGKAGTDVPPPKAPEAPVDLKTAPAKKG